MSKILIVSQHYYPENFRVTDIAETLFKNGNEVTVVCGYPNYPEGNIYEGYYGKGKKEHKEEVLNGVKVLRCYEHPRKKSFIHLFFNYYSVSLSMKRRVKKIKEKFDCVLINQLSPVMQAWGGIAYAKKHKVPCFLYCYDLWPDSLAAGGIKKGSLIYNYYQKVSNKIYKKVDKIMVTSKNFINYFKQQHGIEESKLMYLPQYCEDVYYSPTKREGKKNINYVFAGNVGKMQSVETIIRAANIIKNDKEIKIHIVGSGSNLDSCKKMAKDLNLDNVVFHGQHSVEEMPKFYEMATAMLVTLGKNDVISYTLPGKVQSYMCAGKPIIASIDGETQMIMKEANCGMYCDSEDYEGLAEIMLEFKAININEMGNNARKYYEEHFRKGKFFENLSNIMEVK